LKVVSSVNRKSRRQKGKIMTMHDEMGPWSYAALASKGPPHHSEAELESESRSLESLSS
jgi:hypothetical protein